MPEQWFDRRKEYRYAGFLFSGDGSRAKESDIEYDEIPFAESANKRFRIWLAVVLLFTFPGIPLLVYLGLNEYLLWIALIVGGVAYWLHGRIHACPGCGGKSRTLCMPHMGSPVLYLCPKCRTFFEHGEIDGG